MIHTNMMLLFNIANELCKMHAYLFYFRRIGAEFFTNADNFSLISKFQLYSGQKQENLLGVI